MATTQDLLYRVTVNDTQLDGLIAKTATLGQSVYGSTLAFKPLDAQLRATGRRTVEIGRYFTRNFTMPVLFGAAAAIKMGTSFDQALSRIQTVGGASGESLNSLRKQVESLAGHTLDSPTQLADALYFIRSSGFKAAEGMDVLRASNKAAFAGLGSTKDVADAVTSAMNAYGHANLSASRATDILISTVRIGKAEPTELAKSIGRVIPLAKQMGVQFYEVGGAIAAMTLQGLNTNLAVTGLRSIFTTFTRGLPITEKALAALGLSLGKVQAAIRNQGLEPTLMAIRAQVDKLDARKHVIDSVMQSLEKGGVKAAEAQVALAKATGDTTISALSRLFPNVRALTAFLILTSRHGKDAAQAIGGVKDSIGETNRAAAQAAQDPGKKLIATLRQLQFEATEFGRKLEPAATKIAALFQGLFHIFNQLPKPLRDLVGINIILLGVVGPVLTAIGQLIRLSSFRAIRQVTNSRLVRGSYESEAAAVGQVTKAEQLAADEATKAQTQTQLAVDKTTEQIGIQKAAWDSLLGSEARVSVLSAEQAQAARVTGLLTPAPGTRGPVRGALYTSGMTREEAIAAGSTSIGPGRRVVVPGTTIIGAQDEYLLGSAATKVGTMERAVGGLRGALTGLRGALGGALAGLGAIADFIWPIAVTEGVILIWQNWDLVSKKLTEVDNKYKEIAHDATRAVPGGGLFKDVYGFLNKIANYPGKKLTEVPGFGWLKYLGVGQNVFGIPGTGELVNLIKMAAAHQKKLKEESKGAASASNENKDYVVQMAHNLGISVEKMKELLGLTKSTSAAANTLKTNFENAFSRLSGDLDTAFTAVTNQMLTNFDNKTEAIVNRMKVTVTVMGRTFTMKPGDKTPAERELAALDKVISKRQEMRDLLDAGQQIRTATLIGDPFLLRDAQRKAEDARDAIQRDALQTRADRERKAVDAAAKKDEAALRARRARQRLNLESERTFEQRNLDDRLKDLQTSLENHRITVAQFNTKLRALMAQYGVTASDGAKVIGDAWYAQIGQDQSQLNTAISDGASLFKTKSDAMASAAESSAARIKKAYAPVLQMFNNLSKSLSQPFLSTGTTGVGDAKVTKGYGQVSPQVFNWAAGRTGVPAALIKSVAISESGAMQARHHHIVTSSAGALGVMQLLPETARMLGVDPRNLQQNVYGGAKYLAQLYKKYGSWYLALVAYNEGPGALDAQLKRARQAHAAADRYIPSGPSQYARTILGRFPGIGAPAFKAVAGSGGFVPTGQSFTLERGQSQGDMGRDILTTPGGYIIAPGDGYCVDIKTDPKGFGPDYPIIHFTTGPFKGHTMYIGHVDSLLRKGQRFRKGQRIARTRTRGHGYNAPAGWAEIGYGIPGTRSAGVGGTPFGSDSAEGVHYGGRQGGPSAALAAQTAAAKAGLPAGMRRLPGIPGFMQVAAHHTLELFARRLVRADQLAFRAARGGHVSFKEFAATLPPMLSSTLTAAQKARLGPAGVAAYLQRLRLALVNPIKSGLIVSHPDRPFTLGQAGLSGNVNYQNITININKAASPRETAMEVRDILQKHAARNAISPRGRYRNQKIGAR